MISLMRVHRVRLLRQAQRPADDGGLGGCQHAGDPGRFRPCRRPVASSVSAQSMVAAGRRGRPRSRPSAPRRRSGRRRSRGSFLLQQEVAERLEQRQVPAHLDLQVFVGQRGAVAEQPGGGLWVLEVEQPGLGQRVDRDDLAAVVLAVLQRGEHPRVVRAGVLPDDEDEVGVVDVVQRHGPLADADGLVQRRPRGLVAHVGAVGQVVGAVGRGTAGTGTRPRWSCGPRCRTTPRSRGSR